MGFQQLNHSNKYYPKAITGKTFDEMRHNLSYKKEFGDDLLTYNDNEENDLEIPQEVLDLFKTCLNSNSKNRPAASDCLKLLSEFRDKFKREREMIKSAVKLTEPVTEELSPDLVNKMRKRSECYYFSLI